jgi:hypothetical protein
MLRQERNKIMEFLHCEGHSSTNHSPRKASSLAACLSHRAGEYIQSDRNESCPGVA